ncbi:MAG: MFS transporter [Gemmatimonadaceae bacterium]|nr:MFS transporter [Gemmatimonadaceae bacterium]
MQVDVTHALSSPVVRLVLAVIGGGLLYVLGRELRKIPPKLMVLMATAFMDMVGLLMVVPLLPFYVKKLGGEGVELMGMHLGIGILSGIIASAFTVAQLLSSPLWGRFSDKFGRRPALLIALSAAGVAYLVFGFAESLWVLFLSRIVQGAGGGTVGVIQAYVADTTEPGDRARSLGWLSAATNLGVALGPVVGAFAVVLGERDLVPGSPELRMGEAAPGIVAALLCAITILFAWKYLKESKEHQHHESERRRPREAVLRVLTHGSDPSSRLIWIYAIAIGAFQGIFPVLPLFLNAEFQVTERTIGYFFMYIGSISVFARVLLLGKLVDRIGEARLSRVGLVLLSLGLAGMPLAPNLWVLAVAVAMLPLGTAFTFPCVTALLSRVINPADRGLYMGLQQSFGGVSRIIAPLWAGFAFDTLGQGIPFFTSAAIVVATISLGLGLDQYARRPGPVPAPGP